MMMYAHPPLASKAKKTKKHPLKIVVAGMAVFLCGCLVVVLNSARNQQPLPNEVSAVERVVVGPALHVKAFQLDCDRLIFPGKNQTMRIKAEKAGVQSLLRFRSNNPAVATVDTNGVVTSHKLGNAKIATYYGGHKKTVAVCVANKWAALTFDDGPDPNTPELLTFLKKENVQATFFLVGSRAKSYQKTVRREAREGHEVANHTYNHNAAASTLMTELAKTDKYIKKATGKESTLMRPPGGAINSQTTKTGKAVIIWAVDPFDWRDRNSDTVYSRVMSATDSGDIVLMHDIHSTTIPAAKRIVKSLKAKHYALVTVSDLIGNPKAGKIYHWGDKKVRKLKIKY